MRSVNIQPRRKKNDQEGEVKVDNSSNSEEGDACASSSEEEGEIRGMAIVRT